MHSVSEPLSSSPYLRNLPRITAFGAPDYPDHTTMLINVYPPVHRKLSSEFVSCKGRARAFPVGSLRPTQSGIAGRSRLLARVSRGVPVGGGSDPRSSQSRLCRVRPPYHLSSRHHAFTRFRDLKTLFGFRLANELMVKKDGRPPLASRLRGGGAFGS